MFGKIIFAAMGKILITGATGNVGLEVIRSLGTISHHNEVIAGVRNLAKNESKLSAFSIQVKAFDFDDSNTYRPAFQNCDTLFLVRPPQIANVKQYFEPLIEAAQLEKLKHIVFLSVQGAEKNKFIPHHKIERLISGSGIAFTFLRPSYFMQNFTTTLLNDVRERKIFLPAGKARFTLVDVRDIGAVAAQVLSNPLYHKNKAYELTNDEKLSFKEMANILSTHLGETIKYCSPDLLQFFVSKKKQGMPATFIMVMILLHYFPRFQKTPQTTNCIEQLTGKKPTSFNQFVFDHLAILKSVNNKP